MRNFVLGFFCGAVALYGSMSFHVVRAEDGHHVIKKTSLTFYDTYVDIRAFGLGDWKEHAALADALQKSEKKDLMQGATEHALRNSFDRLLHGNNQP
ncbi:MAG: hypothetical protein U0935_11720 [Pirellulales bacterium]